MTRKFLNLLLPMFAVLVPVCQAGANVPSSQFPTSREGDPYHEIIVSVKDQKLVLMPDGRAAALYPDSTTRFGIDDRSASYATPQGRFLVRSKIGMGLPLGTVFKSRHHTGEVVRPNTPGSDPIVTMIL